MARDKKLTPYLEYFMFEHLISLLDEFRRGVTTFCDMCSCKGYCTDEDEFNFGNCKNNVLGYFKNYLKTRMELERADMELYGEVCEK